MCDTISLARLGASMTGLGFSPAALNHGLGEIVTALLDAGLELTGLAEHDSVPWDAMPGMMAEAGGGEWRLADRPWRLAHTYTLQAVKLR